MAFGRDLRLGGVAFFLWSFAYNLTAPLLPLFARELGASSVGVGLVAAASAAGAVVMVLPLSAISDRVGRRAALIAGWSLSAAGVLLMAAAQSWQALLPGAFLSLGAAAALPTLNTVALEETAPGDWARAFALLYAAGPLGLLGGSALGGMLAETYGLRMVVYTAGAACLAAVMAVLPINPDDQRAAGGGSGHAPGGVAPDGAAFESAAQRRAGGRRLAMVGFGVAAAVGFLVVSLPSNFIVPYLREVGGQSLVATGLYSALLALAQLGWSLLFTVWPRPSGRLRLGSPPLALPVSTLTAVAVCLAATGMFGLILPLPVTGLWAGALMLRGSHYALQSLGSSLLGDVVAPGPRRTTRLTFFSAAVGVGAAAAPVVAGWLYEFNPAYPFWVASGAATAAAAVLAVVLLFWPRAGDAMAHPGVG